MREFAGDWTESAQMRACENTSFGTNFGGWRDEWGFPGPAWPIELARGSPVAAWQGFGPIAAGAGRDGSLH